jgi:hypothetical protein
VAVAAKLVLAGFAPLPAQLLDDYGLAVTDVEPDLARVDDQEALHWPAFASH